MHTSKFYSDDIPLLGEECFFIIHKINLAFNKENYIIGNIALI